MQKLFFESSAVDHAVRQGFDPEEVVDAASAQDLEPAVGLHVIYELACTFLDPANRETAARLFGFLDALQPTFQPPVAHLLRDELTRLRTNAAVLPFLNHLDLISTKAEVKRLASGHLDPKAHSFIQASVDRFKTGHPQWARQVLDQARGYRKANPTSSPRFSTFEQTLCYFQSQGSLAELIFNVVAEPGLDITRAEAAELEARLQQFPAIRAITYANVYLNFVCLSDRRAPGLDKIGDFRHLVEAAYCHTFATQDKQLQRTASHICPSLQVVSIQDFMTGA